MHACLIAAATDNDNIYDAEIAIAGLVTISPPEIASACNGDQLNLTCNVTGTFLQWSSMTKSFTLTSLSTSNQIHRLEVNSSLFTFLRISAANSIPLISRLIINATSHSLNQTVVTCLDVEALESVSTTINIIKVDQLIQGELQCVIPYLSLVQSFLAI